MIKIILVVPCLFLQVPDYHEIIKNPMDLSTMMSKIDLHQYQCCKEFLDDIDLICSNALEYNPADSTAGRSLFITVFYCPLIATCFNDFCFMCIHLCGSIYILGRAIRHRACALKDMAHALTDAELDEDFEKQCIGVIDSRRNRG